MIITSLLLLPILTVLYWIYWLVVGKQLSTADKLILFLTCILMFSTAGVTHYMLREWPQPIWPFVIAPMVGYGTLLSGMLFAWLIHSKTSH